MKRARAISAGLITAGLLAGMTGEQAVGADYPPPAEGDFLIRDFKFASGESLPELRIHYRSFGSPQHDAHGIVRNAILILHGTGGSGASLVRQEFAGELFAPGQLLDASRYYIVLPDGIGHGGYRDMVQAQYLLLTQGLKVNHARLVMCTSMGAMHTWLWGELHPKFMDALMPLASLPTQVAGRNRVWRRLISDAIRNDPDWQGGEYHAQPSSLRTALEMIWLVGSNPALRQAEAPTLADADRVIDHYVQEGFRTQDANDILYAVEASHDYDPGPALAKIEAPLMAVNSADDLINPPELQILEREIQRVPQGRAVVIPF